MLRIWADRLATLPDDYIAHEFLEETNQPSTVRAFAAGAARHGLGFLGECDLAGMIPENYGEDAARRVRALSGNDLVETEQYLDLLSGRTFRNTLLVSNERLATVKRASAPETIAAMHVLTAAGMRLDRDGDRHVLTDAAGRTLTTTSDAVAAGIEQLLARFPASSSVDDLVRTDQADDRAAMLDALYRMALIGMATLSAEPVEAVQAADRPVAIARPRADAAARAGAPTKLRPQSVAHPFGSAPAP